MATVKFFLDHPKEKGTQKLKASEVSIMVKLAIDRDNRFDLSTKDKIVPKFWDTTRQEVKSSYRGAIELNLSLSKIKTDLIQLWRENKSLSVGELRELAKPLVKYGTSTPPVQKKTLFEAFDKFLIQYSKEKDSKTYAKYKGLKSKLLSFNPDLDFKDIDFNFYDDFKQYLYAIPNPNYPDSYLQLSGDHYNIVNDGSGLPVGIFDDTVFKYFTLLKTFLTWATKRGHEVDQSYNSWTVIKRQHKPISLTLAELESLEAADMPTKTLEVARDYLALECRTGQRISDLKRFDLKDYQEFKWTFTPRKGNRISSKKITVHFTGYCAKALLILAKYNFQPPKISEQKLNKYIKQACREAGITQEVEIFRYAGNKRIRIAGPKHEFISTHTGRKTFITIALQYIPAKVVKELAGIDSYQTLKHYEGDSDHSIIEGYLNNAQESISLLKKAQ